MGEWCPGTAAELPRLSSPRTIVTPIPDPGTGQRDLLGVKRTIVRNPGGNFAAGQKNEQLLPVLEAAGLGTGSGYSEQLFV